MLKTFYCNFTTTKIIHYETLSHSEFQRVGHGYLNCLLSCFCILFPESGLQTQVQRAEHLPIAELFNLERAYVFHTFSSIDSENNSLTDNS